MFTPFGYGSPRRAAYGGGGHPMYAAGPYGVYPRDPYEVVAEDPYQLAYERRLQQEKQRRLAEEQRRQQLHQQQRREAAAAQARKRALQAGMVKAAIRIQRWFRKERQAAERRRQQAAALVIARVLQGAPKIRQARRVRKALTQLRDLQAEIKTFVELRRGYVDAAERVDKDFLYFVDTLEKFQLRMDMVPTCGSETVRHKRKSVVAFIEDALRKADQRRAYLDELETEMTVAAQIIRLFDGSMEREELERLEQDRRQHSAVVLQRWYRRARLLRRGRAERWALTAVRALRTEAQAQQAELVRRLRSLATQLDAVDSLPSSALPIGAEKAALQAHLDSILAHLST